MLTEKEMGTKSFSNTSEISVAEKVLRCYGQSVIQNFESFLRTLNIEEKDIELRRSKN